MVSCSPMTHTEAKTALAHVNLNKFAALSGISRRTLSRMVGDGDYQPHPSTLKLVGIALQRGAGKKAKA